MKNRRADFPQFPLRIVAVSGWGYSCEQLKSALPDAAAANCENTLLDWTAALDIPRLADILSERNKTVIAVGWSIGALALVHAVSSVQGCAGLQRLILLGATARFISEPDSGYAGTAAVELRAMRALLMRDPEQCLTAFFARCCAQRGCSYADDVRLALDRWPSTCLREGLDYLRDTDVRQACLSLNCPVSLVHGACDSVVPPSQSAWMAAAIPDCKRITMPWGVHTPGKLQLECVAQLIREFSER